MNSQNAKHITRAFTIFDLLVVIGILAVAAFLALMVGMEATYGRAGTVNKIKCVNNLKSISIASRIFANDHDGKFPWETNSAEIELGFLNLKEELSTPKVLVCKSDLRTPSSNWQSFSRSNTSYFINPSGENTNLRTFLAGDRNLATNGVSLGGRVTFPRATLPEWDKNLHKSQGNVVLSDGSVQQLTNIRLQEQWRNAEITNEPTFLFP